ncbi:MAG: Bax inhibitor-1/YccA family protein [Alphaproteobacteria bacterium]|nr:Bax inhibitor-1/YccA family protein [Alphaproteobacteria bacterium]
MNPIRNQQYAGSQTDTYDEGLRTYMLGVYNYMTAALALTGFVAYLGANVPAILSLLYKFEPTTGMATPNILAYIVMFAPLGMVFFLSARLHKLSAQTAKIVFFLFASLMGLSLTHVFLLYTGESVFSVFLITSASFGALSLYGYSTKKDLSAMGSFLIMGVFGILIASIANIFIGSSGLFWVINVLGVLIFAGLTAYDTQAIRRSYYEVAGNAELAARMSIMGALRLYLDFINMFIFLLHFLGERR